MTRFRKRSGCAIVIGSNDTALNTARCLSEGRVDVHLVYTTKEGLAPYTRTARTIDLTHLANDEQGFIDWLHDYASRLHDKPALMPCGDRDAIMLARHRDRLEAVCHLWSNELNDLLTIISKDRLTLCARQLGIAVPPMIVSPGTEELSEWVEKTLPPYLIKPYYLGVDGTESVGKNRVFDSADELLEFIQVDGSTSIIVQKLIRGGDGWIYDCYGLCGRDGHIVTMATHKRIRQHPHDRGVTCYGEIPAPLPNGGDGQLFNLTKKLLGGLRYHGIFGIEWIQDRDSGEFCLLDFNARPFITIRHLSDCGLNLPLLAYDDVTGADIGAFPLTPALKHKYWVDVLADARTFRELRKNGALGWGEWFLSIARCRSFAILCGRDAVPSLMHIAQAMTTTSRFALQRIFRRK